VNSRVDARIIAQTKRTCLVSHIPLLRRPLAYASNRLYAVIQPLERGDKNGVLRYISEARSDWRGVRGSFAMCPETHAKVHGHHSRKVCHNGWSPLLNYTKMAKLRVDHIRLSSYTTEPCLFLYFSVPRNSSSGQVRLAHDNSWAKGGGG
jgi:hypothetical protein